MKKLSLLLFFVFLQESLDAQMFNKMSVELNIGRCSKEIGLFDSDYYSNEISYLNGFNFGYHPSEKWQYYLGLRKIFSPIESGGGFSFESIEKKGLELRIGAKFSPGSEKLVFFSYGLELFNEISNLNGTYAVDYGGPFEVNHLSYYIGMAPNVTINLKVKDRIVIFADTRFRFGRSIISQKESTQANRTLWPSISKWLSSFEPLNSLGIRLHFK